VQTLDGQDNDLERLLKAYLNLTDEEKGNVIRLGENLLNSQKTFCGEISVLADKKESNIIQV
jgi:hypothetical protein